MNKLDKFATWLTREENDADSFREQAKTATEAEYWRGYAEAMINAAAAYYGPTPLEEEEN